MMRKVEWVFQIQIIYIKTDDSEAFEKKVVYIIIIAVYTN